MKPKKKEMRMWIWELEDGSLCYWGWRSEKQLREHGKPSPGARPVAGIWKELRGKKP